MRTIAIVSCTLTCALSHAAPAHKQRVAILPAGPSGHDPAEAKVVSAVESALVDATRKLSAVELVNFEGGKLRGPSRADLKADPRPSARAQALAREQSAELAIVAETQPLGEGAVVYLQIVEVGGKVRGSTTAAISAEALLAGDVERVLRGGLVQVLDPQRYVGRLDLHIDVKGAETEVDGRKIPPAAVPGAAFELPVGTHAVRVTHPAYHDFLRFVEVGFDRTSTETVALAAFPLTEGEMNEKKHRATGPKLKVPWYRSWWALGVTGVVLAGATAGLVYGLRPGVSSDENAHYKATPSP